MNINPHSPTSPHYDSYEDFYKFFEVASQNKPNKDVALQVFPPPTDELPKQEEIRDEKSRGNEK